MEVVSETKAKYLSIFRSDIFFFTLLIFSIFYTRWSTLSQVLVERHDFRQTQTAYQTLTLANGAGSLLKPHLPIFGSPWTTPFEFPSFQFVASLLYRAFNLEIDFANRLTALIFFTLCLFPLYMLSLKLMSRVPARCCLLLFAFSPFAIQWSRASMIEYFALFFGLLFVLFLNQSWIRDSWLSLSGSVAAGALCGVTKSTTLIPMVMVVFLFLPGFCVALKTPSIHLHKLLKVFFSIAISLLAIGIWTWWADHLKNLNPATNWLISKNLQSWTFGTLQQRSVVSNWFVILDRVDHLILGRISLIFILVIALFSPDYRGKILILVGSAFATIAIFFNLYYVHDYYLVAISPMFVMSLSLTLDSLSNSMRRDFVRNFFLTVVTIGVLFLSITSERPYWNSAFIRFPRSTPELIKYSTPKQYSFVSFGGWNPLLLYYSQRSGMMLDSHKSDLTFLKSLPDLDKYDFYAGYPDRPDVMKIRGWYLPIGTQTTRIDDNLNDFLPWGFAFGSKPVTYPPLTRSFKLLVCNGQDSFNLRDLKIGTSIYSRQEGEVLVSVSPSQQLVPIGEQIKIIGTIPKSLTAVLACTGGGSIALSW